MKRVNLIPAARHRARQRRIRLHRWGAVVGGNLVLAGIAFVLAGLMFRPVDGSLRKLIDDLDATMRSANVAASHVRVELAELQTELDANLAVAGQPDWSILQSIVAGALEDQIVLERFQVGNEQTRSAGEDRARRLRRSERVRRTQSSPAADPSRLVLGLAGLGESQYAVSQFALRLEDTGLFDLVQVVDTRREPYLDGFAVAFRIECGLKTDAVETTP